MIKINAHFRAFVDLFTKQAELLECQTPFAAKGAAGECKFNKCTCTRRYLCECMNVCMNVCVCVHFQMHCALFCIDSSFLSTQCNCKLTYSYIHTNITTQIKKATEPSRAVTTQSIEQASRRMLKGCTGRRLECGKWRHD